MSDRKYITPEEQAAAQAAARAAENKVAMRQVPQPWKIPIDVAYAPATAPAVDEDTNVINMFVWAQRRAARNRRSR